MNKTKIIANVYENGKFLKRQVNIEDGKISFCASDENAKTSLYVFPGFVDVHVHLREPGFSYKETILTGTLASARGGYSAVCSMANLNPVPDCAENIKAQLDIINRDAKIRVYPYASITKEEKGEELSSFEQLKDLSIAFSDDGRGVQSDDMMEEAMKKAKALSKMIVAHCEDNSLLNGGYIHDGEYAKKHLHKGISSKSEWVQIKRDLALAEKTGVAYHICHVSTKESVELIRDAKKRGVNVSAETAPHYLILTDDDLQEEGRFKMNPPLRAKADRDALIKGIKDGTIDMIATDHAPHSKEEKSKGLERSLMGVVGIETAFPILYTHLVKKDIITLEKLIEIMAIAPAKRFDIPTGYTSGDFTIFDLEKEYVINPEEFLSKGRSTPFEGEKVFGECIYTSSNGNVAYSKI